MNATIFMLVCAAMFLLGATLGVLVVSVYWYRQLHDNGFMDNKHKIKPKSQIVDEYIDTHGMDRIITRRQTRDH